MSTAPVELLGGSDKIAEAGSNRTAGFQRTSAWTTSRPVRQCHHRMWRLKSTRAPTLASRELAIAASDVAR